MFPWLPWLKVVRRSPYVFDIPFSLQTLSYNKYNLKPQTSEKQAKEILIRRQNTLRESMRKGHSLPWGKPVHWGRGLGHSFSLQVFVTC